MSTMLDIAGGIIIGGATLGVFYFGLMAISGASDDEKAVGSLMIFLSLVFAFWLILIRTEVIPIVQWLGWN